MYFKYGASAWRARKLPTGTMENFQRFFELDGIYDDVGQMLAASDNASPVAKTALERLKINGLSQEYIQDVLGPQVRRHTGQGVDELSDLALSMALDREDQGVLKSEVGGRLTTALSGFVNQSKVQINLNSKVTGLGREMVAEGRKSWILGYMETGSQNGITYDTFDKVIIAAPWNTSSLSFETTAEDDQIHYRSQWLTFFVSHSTLNTTYFGAPATLPAQILPIPSSKLLPPFQGIQEIAHLKVIARYDHFKLKYQTEHLYRILSDHKLDNSTINQFSQEFDSDLLSEFLDQEFKAAYPLLYARSGGFPKFRVAEGLWHTSVMEAIASSVDLSWMAGENVARLVVKEIKKERE